MKYVIVVIQMLLVSGCAKFDFLMGSGTVTAFQITSPSVGTAIVPSSAITISGLCEPDGGVVTITGTSIVEPFLASPCDPILGTFSVIGTSQASGELLDIQGSQLSAEGVNLSSSVSSIMIHCAGAPMRTCSLSGSGNSSDPYIVGDILCLQEMRTGLTCNYALNNDIDATAVSILPGGWEPVPNSPVPTVGFTGTLDGRNHSISNFYTTPRDIGNSGFFSRLYDEGNGTVDDQIYDLTFVNPTADQFSFSNNTFGFIAGSSELAGIRNVNIVNGDIEISTFAGIRYIALLVGRSRDSQIQDTNTSGEISFDGWTDLPETKFEQISGFIGELVDSEVSNSSSDIVISSLASPLNVAHFKDIGGAFGSLTNSSVVNFRTNSTISLIYEGVNTLDSEAILGVGGFAGSIYETASLQNICVDHNISLTTTQPSANIQAIGGHVGRSFNLIAPLDMSQVGVRGDLSAEPQNSTIDGVSVYIGRNAGTNVHTNIYMNSNINLNGNSTPGSGYGGLTSLTSATSTFTNVLGVSSHTLSAGIDDPGGLFYDATGVTLNSVFYANDSGLPAAFIGGAGIVSDSLLNLSGLPNPSYTGYDFVTVWQRDLVTGLPELRYCP